MTHYHVFLPPQIYPLSVTGQPQADTSLHFEELIPPIRHESFSQSLQRRVEIARYPERQQEHLAAPVHEMNASASGNKRRRSRGEDDTAGNDAEGYSKGDYRSGDKSRKGGLELSPRRRSKRLDRTAGSLLGTLPQLDQTESFLSLNTTNSNPSQFPPSALGNDSVYNLPRWTIPLSRLTNLQTLLATSGRKEKQTVTLMVCVISVDQPKLLKRKEEKARGWEGTLWVGKWVVTAPPIGGEAEVSCEVKLWDELAREWGDDRVRKGDVVLLENVEYKPATSRTKSELTLTRTLTHTPKVTILYRTLPRYTTDTNAYTYKSAKAGVTGREGTILIEDRLLRPDLRLARSDAGLRKVVEFARWFAEWVGGEVPP